MSKIGVGIGEDFPADDSKPAQAPRGDRQDRSADDARRDDEYEARRDAEYEARREAYRKWREHRREWRRQWREEWRARRRDFRNRMRESIHESYGDDRHYRHYGAATFWGPGLLWGVLGLIAVIALISFVFSHIYIVAGVIALLALFAAYHRGHDPFEIEPYDYSGKPPAPPREAAH